MNLWRPAFAAMAACFLWGCAHIGPPSAPPQQFLSEAQAATDLPDAAARIRADVEFLADDAREGREAGSPGYDAAADYVAARMALIGLKPAGDSWFQEMRLRFAHPALEAAALSVTGPDGEETKLVSLEDFRVFPSIASESFSISAPAVFVGYGVHAPDFGEDDFDGLDVEGKIIVYLSGAPESFDSEARAHFARSGTKFAYASLQGAIGAIGLPTKASDARYPWERVIKRPDRPSTGWVGPSGEVSDRNGDLAGTAFMNAASAEVFFAGAPKSYADLRAEADAGTAPQGFDLAIAVSMAGGLTFEERKSANVVGVIEGSDKALRDEYVVLTAHLDHLGVSKKLLEEGKDGVYNGAMDNAIGVALMLEAAREFAGENAPKRSILVAAVTAEEKGLIGADYLVEYPPVPQEDIVANINLDMPVMLHSFRDVVAFGAEHSSLGPIAEKAVARAGAVLAPDPIPEQGIFTRSDHYRFVQRGIPSLYLWPGFANGGEETFTEFFENCYHKPCDEIDQPILYEDLARFGDVNVAIARAVAEAPARPVWNEGDLFGLIFASE